MFPSDRHLTLSDANSPLPDPVSVCTICLKLLCLIKAPLGHVAETVLLFFLSYSPELQQAQGIILISEVVIHFLQRAIGGGWSNMKALEAGFWAPTIFHGKVILIVLVKISWALAWQMINGCPAGVNCFAFCRRCWFSQIKDVREPHFNPRLSRQWGF